MSRNLSQDFINGLQDDILDIALAVEMDFSGEEGGQLRFWSGLGDLQIGNDPLDMYIGSGALLSVKPSEEANGVNAKGATIALSGIDQSITNFAIGLPYQNRPANILLGIKVDNVYTWINVFSGFMDTMTITEDGEASNIEIKCENRLIDMLRPRERRYTKEDQQSRFPSDKGLNFVHEMKEKQIIWGRKI